MQTESSVFDGDLDRLGVSSIWSFVKIKQQIRADWDKTLGRTKPGSIAKIDEDTPAPIKRIDQNKRPFIRRWMAVAAAVLLFALTWSLYNQVWNLGKAAENDVIAGGNRATLTLSGGRTVVLAEQSEGLMLDDSGVQIKKTDDGQLIYVLPDHDQLMAGNNGVMVYNTVTTPRTGRYSVVLPDGSVVTLNAAFSLRYPIRFDSKSREVELEGEAFFEVAKLETKNENDEFERVPFHVRTGNQDIHVLGTSFNVNAYKDEETTW